VDYRPLFSDIQDGFTFEAKMKIDQVLGERVYLAGIWGPNEEDNDAWVLYINDTGDLVFEVENPVSIPKTEDRASDNTIAISPNFAPNFGTWTHIAAVFDPDNQSSYLYINGVLSATGNNSLFPITRMSTPNNMNLGMLIGSANKVTDPEAYKSLKGQMDEIKIWSVPQTAEWIDCNKGLNHSINSSNLLLYYRANDPLNSYTLCDASGNGLSGSLRDSRLIQNSFPDPRPFKIYEQPTFPDTLKCVSSKTYRFVIEDTSVCASGLNIRAYTWEINDENKLINRNSSDLVPVNATPQNIQNGILEYEFVINADWIGTKRFELRLQRNNSCGVFAYRNRDVYITRITDIAVDIGNDTLDYGKISSFCESEQVVTESITISNNSDQTGTNRPLTISAAAFSNPMWTLATPTLPLVIPVGQSRDINFNCANPNTAGIYKTDITITTDDQCSDGIYTIPAQVEVEDVFQITARNGTDSVLNHDFGIVCLGQISRALTFFTDNLSSRDIKLLDVSYPTGYDTRVDRNLPKDMPANTSFSDEYFIMIPQNEGDYSGTIIFTVETDNGCIIKYPIDITGSAINPDFEFILPDIDFGNVVVGQELTLPIEIRNKSTLPLSLDLTLNKSEVFFFTGGNSITLPPTSTRSVDATFQPTAGELYLDKLVAWERNCNNTYGIDLQGQGILEALSFTPEISRIDDVLGCGDGLVVGSINNISANPITVDRFILDDPSAKFAIETINGVSVPTLSSFSTIIQPGASLEYSIRYSPNDVSAERGDRAFLRFMDQDDNDWNAKLYGTSRLPRLYVSNNGNFGVKEVGELEIRTLYVENVSTVGEITLDNIQLALGNQDMTLLYPSLQDIQNRVLAVGDTMQIKLQFTPNSPGSFSDTVIVDATNPCLISGSEPISGFGRTYPLQLGIRDLAMGYAASCECQTKEFYLNNESESFPLVIDSIIFDDTGLNYPSSQYFSWTSRNSPIGVTPYEIPEDSRDTLYIDYCPRQGPNRDSINNETNFRLLASGEGWGPDTFNIYLIGKRKLLFEPTPDSTIFPPTRVDTLSEPQIAYVKVPSDITVNPDNAVIKVESVTFQPDDNVFSVSDSLGREFPIYVSSLDSLNLQFDFHPRAPRLYEAKAVLHI
jgi:hypothetical protein